MLHAAKEERPACPNFSKCGVCKFGAECWYPHIAPPQSVQPNLGVQVHGSHSARLEGFLSKQVECKVVGTAALAAGRKSVKTLLLHVQGDVAEFAGKFFQKLSLISYGKDTRALESAQKHPVPCTMHRGTVWVGTKHLPHVKKHTPHGAPRRPLSVLTQRGHKDRQKNNPTNTPVKKVRVPAGPFPPSPHAFPDLRDIPTSRTVPFA